MNADRLLKYYELVMDVPDAVERLRRFILSLAVRGKLVPRDTNAETAPELRKYAASPNVSQTGQPNMWVRVPVGAVLNFQYGKGLNASERTKTGPVPVYGSNGIVSFTNTPLTTQPCVVVGRKGSAGALNLCNGPSWTTDVAYFVEVPSFYEIRYLLIALTMLDLGKLGKGVKPGLSRSQAYAELISVPPIAEQQRIVAKVDELMALCDRLESARANQEATRDRFTASSFARLDSPDPETFSDDALFVINALPALTARPNQFKGLRQTILNLAVRGKLVRQDLTDETAAELLNRIAKAKAEMKKDTGDARIKVEPNPSEDSLPMALPPGWATQSFENLFLFIDYRGNTPPKTDAGIPLITAKNIRMGYLNREPREYISKETFKTWMTRGLPAVGDLFFTTEAPLANICLNDLDEPFALAQRTICFHPYAEIETRFLMFALMSDVMQSLIYAHATGMTAKGIKAAKLKPLPIPIPPLAEQRRIVAKVDELMGLCTRLAASVVAEQHTQTLLLEALLHEAIESVDGGVATVQNAA